MLQLKRRFVTPTELQVSRNWSDSLLFQSATPLHYLRCLNIRHLPYDLSPHQHHKFETNNQRRQCPVEALLCTLPASAPVSEPATSRTNSNGTFPAKRRYLDRQPRVRCSPTTSSSHLHEFRRPLKQCSQSHCILRSTSYPPYPSSAAVMLLEQHTYTCLSH